MTPRVFTYKGCETCRKATRWLASRGLAFEEIPIREQPPTIAQLKRMLGYVEGEVRRLFNTSGQDYRSLGLKDTLPGLSEKETLALLAGNGNLVKRPFLLGDDFGLLGFREPEWTSRFSA